MNERMEKLLARAAELRENDDIARRREDLVAQAVDAGHSREYADQVYDVAHEEGVDPALAFELVLSGIGVRELAEPEPDAVDEAQVAAPPAWLETAPDPGDAARERRMRASFRRLRTCVERTPTSSDALEAFVREPDVGVIDY